MWTIAQTVINAAGGAAASGQPFLTRTRWWQVVATVAVLIAAALARAAALRAIRQREGLSPQVRRRWIIQTRRLLLGSLAVVLIVIWATQLRLAVLSVAAVAAATVLATRDLIQCVSGALMRSSVRSFEIGDRIEIGDVRGDVIDHSLLATTVLEVGPGANSHQNTGRAVVVPNSLFLDKPLVNESFTRDYSLHTFTIGLDPRKDDWQRAERCVLQAAREVCEPFQADAKQSFEAISQEQGLEMPNLEPRVMLQLSDANKLLLITRIPVVAQQKGRIEQTVLRRYLELMAEAAAAEKATQTPEQAKDKPAEEDWNV